MIVLVNPMLSRTALNADSCYVVLSQFIRRALELRDDLFFEVAWPSNGKDWVYYSDGLFAHERVRRVPLYIDSSKMRAVVSFNPREWEPLLTYTQPVDVVWNHVVEVGDILKGFTTTFADAGKTVVVNAHHYVLHASLPYAVVPDLEHVLLRQLAGSLNVDANVFDSEHCWRMFLENAAAYLAPAQVARLEASRVALAHGTLDLDELDRHRQPRHETFTFAYNHRLQAYKNYLDTFELFDKLHDEGRAFRVKVFTADGDAKDVSRLAHRAYVDVVVNNSRDQYLRELSRCHANVTNSQHETFCISAVESMAYGQALVAPNGVTFPEITGRLEGNAYPFLFDSKVEQLGMMRDAVEGAGDYQLACRLALEHTRARYATDAWARRYLELFDRKSSSGDVLSGLRNPDAWRALLDAKTRWKWSELQHAAYTAKHAGKVLAGPQSFPATKLKRLANQLGFKDAARDKKTGELTLARE